MPPSANLALRELGIVLFLAVVGPQGGGATSSKPWFRGRGAADGLWGRHHADPAAHRGRKLARWLAKTNYLTLCGLLAGSMTDPPALAFANNLHPTSEASSLAYATVYPLVMFLRILSPQLLAILLWVGS